MPQALQFVEQMLDRHIPPGQYLSPGVLAAVQQVHTSAKFAGPSETATCSSRLVGAGAQGCVTALNA
jgi:hypothetical protein